MLTTPLGDQPVLTIERKRMAGIFHISTPSGTYYADDILTSTYVGIVPRAVYQFGDSYMELRFRMGIPLVPEGKGVISIQWVPSLIAALGVPLDSPVHHFVTGPLAMMAFVLVELVNALFLYSSVALPGAVAVAALC